MALKEIWYEKRIGGDYKKLSEEYGVSPVVARLLANRGIRGKEEVEDYFSDSLEKVTSYRDLPDIEKAVSILAGKIKDGRKIRVIGDYDIDGVCSAYILTQGLREAGALVDTRIPHRIKDGYGLNDALVEEAARDGADTIITCDNGIAALDQVKLAHDLGMDIIITDHHEVPFHEENGNIIHDIPEAEAVVDIKLPDSKYPFKEICGAVVVYKLIIALFDHMGIDRSKADRFTEFATFATIGDVMPIADENRKLIMTGLKKLENTTNLGMRALIKEQDLQGKKISVYHVGFVLGPCINATGRLDSAENALKLLEAEDEKSASEYAHKLAVMNMERREMTDRALEKAMEEAGSEAMQKDKVLVIFLPDVHESVAGIVAGRVRERTGKPAFVLTRSEGFVKGSGRSIDEYDMYRAMNSVSSLLTKFGGHKLAGGLSLDEGNVDRFREEINAKCSLTDEDIALKLHFDMVLPFAYANPELCSQIDSLEPFGTGNPRPLFACKNVSVSNIRILGKNKNCLKAAARDEYGTKADIVMFGQVDEFKEYCESHEKISILYSIQTDSYNNEVKTELIIRNYR